MKISLIDIKIRPKLSVTISNIKFPFFEAWRYLNRQKKNLINILVVRKFELTMDYREYQHLNSLDFNGKRISSFLHKLVEIDKRTESELLIQTEIFNQRNIQWVCPVTRFAYGL